MYFDSDGDLVGILNDFDLASVMEPGDRTPEIDGYERVGTKPFMALDLLREPRGQFKRRYRHDLESFAWRLIWEMLEKPPGWANEDDKHELTSKVCFIADMDDREEDVKEEWLPYFAVISTWLEGCQDYSRSINRLVTRTHVKIRRFDSDEEKAAFRDKEEEKKAEKDHLLPVIEAAKAVDSDTSLEVVQDISWLDIELLLDGPSHESTGQQSSTFL